MLPITPTSKCPTRPTPLVGLVGCRPSGPKSGDTPPPTFWCISGKFYATYSRITLSPHPPHHSPPPPILLKSTLLHICFSHLIRGSMNFAPKFLEARASVLLPSGAPAQ